MSPTFQSGLVEIRVQNASNFDYAHVRVVFPDRNNVEYGPVAKGQFSAFRAIRRAYRYAEIHVESGGRDISLQPMDYAGEQELSPGRYTYILRVEDNRLMVQTERAE